MEPASYFCSVASVDALAETELVCEDDVSEADDELPDVDVLLWLQAASRDAEPKPRRATAPLRVTDKGMFLPFC